LDGKQVIAETHSEYLIDRLRLRIALGTDGRVGDFTNILFSNKTADGTKLIPIEVSEYGAVSNWPEDFFDQSQGDVSRILHAAAIKRKAKRNTKHD
jgi:predicted ATPase